MGRARAAAAARAGRPTPPLRSRSATKENHPMFLLDGQVCWSASDLTAASACEYAVARALDYTLGRAEPLQVDDDPLMTHIARLGDAHEAALLAERAGGDLIRLDRVPAPYTAAALEAAAAATHKALLAEPATVFQAAFFDGEFFGYADFLERTGEGWAVCDAKLARSAKPRALLQLGAYADQLARLGLPLAPKVALLLGSGQRAEFALADVLPVYRARRDRLRHLLLTHRQAGPVAWGEESYGACARCAECEHAARAADDLIRVAGMRTSQRRVLRAAGIATIDQLAQAETAPADLPEATFAKLRFQARLQAEHARAGEGAPLLHRPTDTAHAALSRLPKPSAGDLFFDFEGDPLYDEGDPALVGLEYLWGVTDAAGRYTPRWAHDRGEERAEFVAFLDLVAAARAAHPDMHVYHYAPYETTALKRLAIRYQTGEDALDDLLRAGVFVDLYATVRGAVRVSTPSYSIKKLEPLYMGEQLRDAAGVTGGGDSILAYHELREALAGKRTAEAERLRASLEDYNGYDCLSTLRLRDWLLARLPEAPAPAVVLEADDDEPTGAKPPTEEALAKKARLQSIFENLTERLEGTPRPGRSPEQHAWALLATALGYHPREAKAFWWEHYERLTHPLEEWARARDVFVVESAQVEQDWTVPSAKSRNLQRILHLTGDWSGGSRPANECSAVYAAPTPPGISGPAKAPYGADDAPISHEENEPRIVRLVESRKPGEEFADVPLALAPAPPPRTLQIEEAIERVAARAAAEPSLPQAAIYDLLARRVPRLRDNAPLPSGGTAVQNVVAALLAMADSYVAIQGPPGSGKTWSGSRVVAELVQAHGWRVGVVAQSHAVVENMLAGIVAAGLDPALVGKSKNATDSATWTEVKDEVKARAAFLADAADTGCVLGGTAWTFANDRLVEPGGLDLLVVDEAGQFSLASTIGASVCAQRLLLLGDPQQLPQVSKGSHAEPVDASALGWVMDRQDVVPAGHGYFLAESYRMHPALCAKVSTLSYAGRLRAAAPAARRSLEGVEPGLSVVDVDHEGNQTESAQEAAEVLAQIRALIGRTWTDGDRPPRPLTARDFLVVAPYNAQVARIRRVLDAAGLTGVRVGTVDKFQGQEAPVALVSMTASSHGEVPRGMGFLLSRNRVNVAVSRAQWKAIVIRSGALTSFMPSSVEGVLQLGAFIGLCDDGTER
ncbi:MAG: TM0106 family RecB-like putative nuclease [Sporichthyaceae bacterium]